MSTIAITPPATLTPEQIADNAMRAKTESLSLAADNLMSCLTVTRSEGARVIYGEGLAAANTLLATQPQGGAKLVLADILARKLAELHDSTSPAAASPVPSGMALTVHGADVVQFMTGLDALVAAFFAGATGVTVAAEPRPLV